MSERYSDFLGENEEENELEELLDFGDEVIMFTNGCFDLLHFGHVKFLEAAKNLNPDAILVVGINTDSSVKMLKGKYRPIIPEHQRKELLLALKCVDEVVLFSEIDACEIIDRLQPDLYIKSSEYQNKMIPEFDKVVEYGGKIAIITMDEYTQDIKTTKIIDRIVKRELLKAKEELL